MQQLRVRRNQKLFVTDRQEQILTGSLLGDAYITKRGQIQFEQSKNQKAYLIWKHLELSSISYKNISKVERFDKRFHKSYTSYRFWTRQYFLTWRKKFYPNDKKIVPRDIKLTPLVLAVWYMDDGCFSDHKCIIATDGFSKEDIVFLQNLLLELGIKTSVKNESKLLVRKESINTFFSAVSPYILSNLRYKIFDPVTTSRKRDINQRIGITRQYPDNIGIKV